MHCFERMFQVTLLCKENLGNLCGKTVSSLILCKINAKCDCFELRPFNDLCIAAKRAFYKTKRKPTYVEINTKFEVPVRHFFFNHSDSCKDS